MKRLQVKLFLARHGYRALRSFWNHSVPCLLLSKHWWWKWKQKRTKTLLTAYVRHTISSQ